MIDGILKFLVGNKKKIKNQLPTHQTGIIILAHGSKLRDKKSYPIVETVQSTIRKIVEDVKKKNNCNLVEEAYFQFIKPDLHQSIKKLVSKGCKKIIVLPFFLFSGNHVTRDIPEIIKKEEERYKDVKFVITKSVGEDSRIIEIVLELIKEEMVK